MLNFMEPFGISFFVSCISVSHEVFPIYYYKYIKIILY